MLKSVRIAGCQILGQANTQFQCGGLKPLLSQVLEARSRGVQLLAFPAGLVGRTQSELQLLQDSLEEWASEHEISFWIPAIKLRKKTIGHWYISPLEKKVARTVPISKTLISTQIGDFGWIPNLVTLPGFGVTHIQESERIQSLAWMFTSHSLAATHPRNAQWDLLSRARAVEYSSYLIASQFWGESHFGHSRVIDPYGKLLSDRPKGDGIVWAELSNDLLNDAKQDLESSPAAAGEK